MKRKLADKQPGNSQLLLDVGEEKKSNNETKRGPGTPFTAGTSGNPNGRPKKGEAYSEVVRELLNSDEINIDFIINGEKKNVTMTSTKSLYYVVCTAMIYQAIKGNVQAAKELIDRADGKVKDKVELSGRLRHDYTHLGTDDLARLLKINGT